MDFPKVTINMSEMIMKFKKLLEAKAVYSETLKTKVITVEEVMDIVASIGSKVSFLPNSPPTPGVVAKDAEEVKVDFLPNSPPNPG